VLFDRRVAYLGQNAAATTARLAPEDLAELDALGGQVVGDRYADMSGVGRWLRRDAGRDAGHGGGHSAV
jgi:hypothetical protein